MLQKKVKKNKYFFKRLRYRLKRRKYRLARLMKESMKYMIVNSELLKYPFLVKIFRFVYLKGRKFKKTSKWRYFRSNQKYIGVYNHLNKRDRSKFIYFKRRVFFWFKEITKRRLFLLVNNSLVKRKRLRKRNYFWLKKKLFKKENFFNQKNIKKITFMFKLKRLKYIIKSYLKFILKKNNFLLKINDKNFFDLFIKLNSLFIYFKNLIIYHRKSYKYFLMYKDYLLNKKFIYIRSKWLGRIRKRRKFIYKGYKFTLLARKFFKIKRKLFFNFYKLKDFYKTFYYLKVRAVDTNFFITLTNYRHKVIIYRSTGQLSRERRKKVKLSPQTISMMIFDIIKKIKSLKIKYIIVHINSRMNKFIRSVYRTVGRATNVKVVKVEFSKPIPHHFGTRKPKPKRL